ncbi:MAG: apolipoprotein N-acyltransferase [Deltaproteobacteria bacterium]|nr:apolipoprotein N-acyltransferase [Deltaproteobacteria bacterium]
MWSSIISGTLLGFSLPALFNGVSFHSDSLAWVGLVPVYLSLATEEGPWRALWKGLLCGFFLYGISLYWIFIALHTHGEISVFFSLVALVLLVGFLSLYLGGVFALTVFLKNRGVPLPWTLPICWLLQDWLRNFFPFGGFSWSSLAYSQGESLNLIQIADLTGPYGVTFLILVSNSLFGEVILFLKKKGRPPWVAATFFTFLICGTLGYAKFRTAQLGPLIDSLPEKKLALVQGNIPQSEKWEPENIEELLNDHLELSRLAEKEYRPDLILWPEASYPAVASEEAARFQVIDQLKTPLLMGVVSYDGVIPDDWPPPAGWGFHLYNSAMLIRPGGYPEAVYHKNHLVPMGEYVPLPRLLFFMEKLVFGMADFTPGGRFHLMDTGAMKIGVTICYEDLFPEIARRFTRGGANLLVNITNDAWYEKSSAVPQHVEFSRFRAIENRRYLARATNTGITAVFDPLGQEVVRAPLFEKAVLPAIVRLGGPISFYTRHGDLFVYLCFLILVWWGFRRMFL